MSLKQATLMLINILLLLMWFFAWIGTKGIHPPVENMIRLRGEIISVHPANNSINGFIEIYHNNKAIKLATHLRASSFSDFGVIVGREAILLFKPGMKYRQGRYPVFAHLEIVDGEILVDYKEEYNEHINYMKNYRKIQYSIQFLLICFFIWFIISLRKIEGEIK